MERAIWNVMADPLLRRLATCMPAARDEPHGVADAEPPPVERGCVTETLTL
ncbi:MAG TPA: hypothetical protein VHE35_09905 [Kofleriaceae bacterium]|nr:hypothetical protein [Kofleriaceae bacterium]